MAKKSGSSSSSKSRSGSSSRSGSRSSRSGGSARSSRSSGGGAGSNTTTDHDEIRQWAESRGGKPSCVKGTGGGGDAGVLRIDFPGYSGEESLQPISWDEFFEKFDEQGLVLLYQERTADGQESRFNKLVSRKTAAGKSAGRSAGKSASKAGGKSSGKTSGKASAKSGKKTSARGTGKNAAKAKAGAKGGRASKGGRGR